MVVWKVMAYLEQRFIGGRGCWYLNGVELLLEFGPVVVYVRHCDHDTGRRGEGRPSVVPDRHLKTKIKFLRIKCEIYSEFVRCKSFQCFQKFLNSYVDTYWRFIIYLYEIINEECFEYGIFVELEDEEFSFENFWTRKLFPWIIFVSKRMWSTMTGSNLCKD